MPHPLYYALITLFFGAMMFAILAPSLPLMWVAVELTTLVFCKSDKRRLP